MELLYLQALQSSGIQKLSEIPVGKIEQMIAEHESFNPKDSENVKQIEKITNHDVKAVEYFVKNQMRLLEMDKHIEWVHFGLTSQDINNTAFPMMIQDFLRNELWDTISSLVDQISLRTKQWEGIPILARTHGQPASPTTLGKELKVFVERIEYQLSIARSITLYGKFGGATGNMNAHKVTFPDYDWIAFANNFVSNFLGLKRHQTTTQIAHYDDLAQLFQCMIRINSILIDFSRDVWTYISMDYFKQKTVEGEVGSSAMPHKVNPIDFENGEEKLWNIICNIFAFSTKITD